MPSEEIHKGESTLKKNKFHFFKRRPISKTSQTNNQRKILSPKADGVVKETENNCLRENILDSKNSFLSTKNVKTTKNNTTSAANSLFNYERKETSKSFILNDKSINSRSFKKLLNSFRGTKAFALPTKKEKGDQKDSTIFNIFSSEQERDNNSSFLKESTKGIKPSFPKNKIGTNLTKNLEKSLTKKSTCQSLPSTKKEKYVHRENQLKCTQLDKPKPYKFIHDLQEKKIINNNIDSKEKTSKKIIEIYNIIAGEKLQSTPNRSPKGVLLKDLNEKTFLLLKSSLEDYLNKCDKHKEILNEKEEKIKILEAELFQLKLQPSVLDPDVMVLNLKSISKENSQENVKITKALEHFNNNTYCTGNSKEKNDHIYIGLKNLETKYDQLYNAYGCLENESQQVENQNILLQFYRDKSINFLESLYQLFEGLLDKDCLKIYQTCLKNLISNYYLFRTTIMIGSQIESTKSEIDYFFNEIARDTFMKKLVVKLSLLTNKKRILEEQFHQYESTGSSGKNKDI